jgi:hypothetical protein
MFLKKVDELRNKQVTRDARCIDEVLPAGIDGTSRTSSQGGTSRYNLTTQKTAELQGDIILFADLRSFSKKKWKKIFFFQIIYLPLSHI